MKNLVYFLLILLFCACGNKSKSEKILLENATKMSIQYARGFDVFYNDNYKTVVVYNPWSEGEIQQTYFLVADKSIETPKNGIKIVVPVVNIAISSSTHVEFLNLLGELSSVKGVCTPHLIYNDTIRARYAEGQIQSLGDAHNVNLEQLLHLSPDIYFAASFSGRTV